MNNICVSDKKRHGDSNLLDVLVKESKSNKGLIAQLDENFTRVMDDWLFSMFGKKAISKADYSFYDMEISSDHLEAAQISEIVLNMMKKRGLKMAGKGAT